jgi:hypothetical protein
MNTNLVKVDHSALRVNQYVIIALNVLAFIFNLPLLAAVVTAFMLAGALIGVPGFGFLYRYALKPAGIIRPEILLDHPQPHRFAQGLGGVFMLAGTLALFLGTPALGWSLVWMVAALAALNAFGGFCVGCMVYYWLGRFGLPGFTQSPPENTFPGLKPRTSVPHE